MENRPPDPPLSAEDSTPGEEAPRTRLRRARRLLFRIVVGVGVVALGVGTWQAITWPDVGALSDGTPESTAFIDRYRDRARDAGREPNVAWDWVPYAQISHNLKRAVVSSEDLEFFSHDGFSTHEIRQAIRAAWEERRMPRGASTITQQLAKNLWLSPSQNPLRKAKEALLTRQLEEHLTKHRILAIYLNVVEFGPGIYGAEAAARHYFGKSAAGLTAEEGALLAASLPRPSSWNPSSTSQSYRASAARIQRIMERAQFLRTIFGLPSGEGGSH